VLLGKLDLALRSASMGSFVQGEEAETGAAVHLILTCRFILGMHRVAAP
jgi:hypothetical protein